MPKTHVEELNKPSKLVELHAKEFSVDLKVQREVNEARVEQMAENFQPHALGIVTASKRADGHIYVLDGGHRVSAARKAHYDGLLATRLFENLTLAEEANLFLALNHTRRVQAIDRFKVRITMGDPAAESINKVLKRYGLHVDWNPVKTAGTVSAITTLEKVYAGMGIRKEGQYPDLVDKVIRTLQDAYGSPTGGGVGADRMTYSKAILEGLAIFVATFGSRINYERLNTVLQTTSPRQIVVQARTLRDAKLKGRGAALGACAAEVIHRLYNFRFKDKLPEFHEVDPRNNYVPDPTTDPLWVDPSQYVREEVTA